MKVSQLKQFLREHGGLEVRCCMCTRGAKPLLFGTLADITIFDDEVRLTAVKPKLYIKNGNPDHYYPLTICGQKLLAQIKHVDDDAVVSMEYINDEGTLYCREPIGSWKAFRSFIVLWAPNKKTFLESLTKPNQ